ncbi:MAG TPA: carboxypeptidase-like regulatory domain-containing protein [Bryobacteraceae bacterium]|nr:carboxypeptidase-like regulatory domain-containing protein [Bryobacteraceae bacterium]
MRTLIAAGVFFLTSILAFGQAGSSLSGVVSDPSGAVIPAASLTLTNIATGVEQTTQADSGGRYNYPSVAPGMYKLIAKHPGFSDVIVNNIELLVSTATTVNVTFEKVGSTTTTIAVEANAVQVNTQDATIGNAINTQQILEIPSYLRNVAALLQFQPGVNTSGNVNGGKSDQGNVTLDGIDVNDQNTRAAFTSVLRVTLDSTQEFRTTTTNANADEGRSSGAQIALVTKSGTNQLHGSLYEYRRGTETAANTFFNNLSGVKNPTLLINIFGGSAGGAIKKNKVFYFINYEGRRDASNGTPSTIPTVPSDLMRAGTLQYINTSGGVTQISPAQLKAQDPAGIGINSAALAMLQLYPHGNDTSLGDGYNFIGYRFTAPQHANQNTYIARFDWNVDSAGKHMVFARGQLQNDSQDGLPQFPGQAPSSVSLTNAKGIAVGYTAALKPNLVNTARYGITRVAPETTGVLSGNYAQFRGLTTIYPVTTGTVHKIPVNQASDELSWTKGAHDIRVGGVFRFVSNNSISYSHSYSSTSSNPSWLLGTGKDLQPPDLSGGFRTNYTYAAATLLGIQAQSTENINYLVDGSTLALGAPVLRDFRNKEFEWYAQDTWKVTRALTVTYGLRHSIMPPIYEGNGQQTSTNISIGDWFYTRGALASVGAPQSSAGQITYIAGNDPKARSLYPNHLTNFAPRLALAYSPQSSSGLSKALFGGPGKTSIRMGWGMYYDLVGQPLAQTYAASAFGLSTTLNNASSSLTSATAPRYTGFYTPPTSIFPPPPKGGFPATYPDLFAITNSIDDTLKAPYTMNTDVSIGREFGRGWYVQGAYVMRLSRRSLVNKDLAQPTNLKDPKSGMTYYQAAQALAAQYNNGNNPVPVANVQKLSFWEDMYPGLAGGGLTATQQAYKQFGAGFSPDYTSALQNIDINCSPSCGIYGPGMIFNEQFSALSAWSSVGKGDYYAMQWTARKRFSGGLTLDFNYTFGRSVDLASSVESGGSFTGVIQNAWIDQQSWAPSNYDARHIINTFAVYQLPFGKDRKFLSTANRLVDGILGGWQLAPTVQWSSMTPTGVGDGSNWATNWEITTNATQIGPVSVSPTRLAPAPSSGGKGGPNLFADPSAAFKQFTFTLPGDSGDRNNIRTPGPFAINLAVSKEFYLYTIHDNPHKLQFRWESFNLTNTAVLSSPSLSVGSVSTFGKFTSQLGAPRQMQFALRYYF